MAHNLDKWLARHSLEGLATILSANDIDLDVLSQLSDQELAEIGISLGNRKRLQKALSSGASEPALSVPIQPISPIGERRQVTILFADLAGFTRIASQLDPEDTHRLLSRYFAVTDRIVTEFGGSIDKHIGDAVMAVFGAPKSHGNDAERAVRAAHAIHQALAVLEPRLEAHIGVAGGEVLASRTGSEDHAEYTVTGPSVNLASRLQHLASAGETLISDDVHDAVGFLAEFAEREEIVIKGLPGSTKAWALTRLIDRRHSSADPFVGRKGELQQAFAMLDAVKSHSRGGVLYVRGEAGIGKTRFVDEIEARARAIGIQCHTGLILDFGVGHGEDAITLIFRDLLSLSGHAHGQDLSEAVDALAKRGAIGGGDKVHALALLSAAQPDDLKSIFDAMDNETRKLGRQRMISALLRQSSMASSIIIRVEDVHWADEATLQALATIATETAEYPVLLVMTSRVEGDKLDHAWRAAAQGCGLTVLDLGPLRKEDALELAGTYITATDSFAQRCIQRAAGNPLFLEQLLRSKATETVPGSVQSIVQARLDQLNDRDRDALRAASVIGQRFSISAIRFVAGQADYKCDQLVIHHLMRPQGEDYLFTHALIRDGVYQSIVNERRRALHKEAAQWFSDRDPVLHAWHLDMAGDDSAPLAYLQAANGQAESHRYESAAELCQRGLALGPAKSTAFSLLCLLGDVQLASNDASASILSFQRAHETAESSTERAQALLGLAAAMRLVDRLSEAEQSIRDAIALASDASHDHLLAKCYFLLGNLEWFKANYAACIASHEASLQHAKRANSAELQVQALGGMGDASYLCGRMRTAQMHFEQCVTGARQAGLQRVTAANRPMLAWCAFYEGDLNGAWQHAISARDEARQISHSRAEIIALNASALIAGERGDVQSILETSEDALKLAQAIGSQRFESMVLMLRSRAHLIEGNHTGAREGLLKSLELAQNALSFIGPWIMGGLALAAKSIEERSSWTSKGLAALERGAVSHNHFFFHSDAMEAYLQSGDWAGARKHAKMLQQYTSQEPLGWSEFHHSPCPMGSRDWGEWQHHRPADRRRGALFSRERQRIPTIPCHLRLRNRRSPAYGAPKRSRPSSGLWGHFSPSFDREKEISPKPSRSLPERGVPPRRPCR